MRNRSNTRPAEGVAVLAQMGPAHMLSICVGTETSRHFTVGYSRPKWPRTDWMDDRSAELRRRTLTGAAQELISGLKLQRDLVLEHQVRGQEDSGDIPIAVRTLTELALAFTPTTVEPRDRCLRCRTTFGYSWAKLEEKNTEHEGPLFPADACAEVIMYLGCLDAHERRKRRRARRLEKKKQHARQAEGRRRRRRHRSRRC